MTLERIIEIISSPELTCDERLATLLDDSLGNTGEQLELLAIPLQSNHDADDQARMQHANNVEKIRAAIIEEAARRWKSTRQALREQAPEQGVDY